MDNKPRGGGVSARNLLNAPNCGRQEVREVTCGNGFGLLEYTYEPIVSYIDGAEVYGVSARMREDGRLICEDSLEDIFCTRAEAENFIAALYENEVDPCHLRDVAEDWLVR